MTGLTSMAALNDCDTASFVDLMGDVFEHAPWVARAVAAQRPFATADALHQAMVSKVTALPEPELVELLNGHPELAGAQARARQLTADSDREQGALTLDTLAQEDASRWDALNAAYKDRFGFPFILCISRHTRASALMAFEQRLLSDRSVELTAAVREIERITRLRLASRIADHRLDRVHGVLTTHVLDTSRGMPAEGMRFALYEVSDDSVARRLIVNATTDSRGKSPAPLMSGAPLRIGRYEMRFQVGEYFRGLGVTQGNWPFLDVVPVVFGIDDPEGNYHVPLTVTPWAYSTYRGQ